MGWRFDRIRGYPIRDVAAAVLPEVDWGDGKRMICCPSPMHDDSSPSFGFHKNRFKCFGCQSSGDAVDLVSLVCGVGLGKALSMIESSMGLRNDGDQELVGLLHEASRAQEEASFSDMKWEMERAADEFFLPLLKTRDPWVRMISRNSCQLVMRNILRSTEPISERGRQESVSSLKKTAKSEMKRLLGSILSITGRDYASFKEELKKRLCS